jgi:hypothetical protein
VQLLRDEGILCPRAEAGHDDEYEHRDGAAAQAQFKSPAGLALLPDGRLILLKLKITTSY